MTENTGLQQKLLERIRARQADISAYIKDTEQRVNRLTNLGIVCTSLTAIFTAGPAIGRDQFTKFMAAVFNVREVAVWGTLCLLAMLLAIAAAIINGLNRAHETAARLAKAQTAHTQFEKLEISLEFENLPIPEATRLYQQTVADLTFIPENVRRGG